MKTATQILEAKISNDKYNLINEVIIPELDYQVRDEFSAPDGIFLEECYKVGDADAESVVDAATAKGFKGDVFAYLNAMDERLIELADELH